MSYENILNAITNSFASEQEYQEASYSQEGPDYSEDFYKSEHSNKHPDHCNKDRDCDKKDCDKKDCDKKEDCDKKDRDRKRCNCKRIFDYELLRLRLKVFDCDKKDKKDKKYPDYKQKHYDCSDSSYYR